MVQCSGMFTDVESARLLPVMRYCSVTAWSSRRVLWGGGTVQLHYHWEDDAPGSAPYLRPRPSVPPLQKSVRSDWLQCRVAVNGAGRAPSGGWGGSQRSSERFWMTSATTVRRRAMTERGSSLPITALPDTIMLAPAWGRSASGKMNHSASLDNKVIDTRSVFLTSAHLSMVSGPTPPSTSMSSEGNWLLNQLTWEHSSSEEESGRAGWGGVEY